MHIKEVMTPMPEKVKGLTTVQRAAQNMKRLGLSYLPVMDHGEIVGLLSAQDIIERSTAKGFDPTKTRVRDIMTTGEILCRETQTIEDVIQQMDQMNKDHLIVLNKNGKVVGVISREDIVRNVPSINS